MHFVQNILFQVNARSNFQKAQAEYALKTGQEVYYITERAVFKLTKDGLCLLEIAPGVDLEKDILDKMHFKPQVAEKLKIMDRRIFQNGRMNLSRSGREE